MNELALFAGSGGGILGGKLLGWRTVCAVELDSYRAERLAQRQNEGFLPAFPIWNGDIADFDGRPWRDIVDVVSGGFPCQDISAANPNAVGITGARSGLWKHMRRIVCEVGPRYIFVENSPMLTGRGLGTVLSDLAALGYDAQWGVLGADDLGGFHRRERLFLVGHANQAGLERQSRDGDINGRQEPAGHFAEAGFRILADTDKERLNKKGREPGGQVSSRDNEPLAHSDCLDWRPKHQKQIGPRERSRQQPCGSSNNVADTVRVGRAQGRAEWEGQQGRPQAAKCGPDALWLDREFVRCKDGKIRATKPGLCGMADGVANRVDRVSAIGDGQVPVVAAAAFEILRTIRTLI